MKLTDMRITEYLDILKSEAPAPGGGSASALAGAQGAALISMVCGLTMGKEKYSEYHEACSRAKDKAEKLLVAFIKAIDEDTEAYIMVTGAFKMPKETENEKRVRSGVIQKATIQATKVPLSVMKLAHQGLKIISGLSGKTNPSAMSDLGVAALNLHSCARGAWFNVKINIPGIKDTEISKNFNDEGVKLYRDSEKVAAVLYELF
jgi:formiminotetrahydrofolate cyclodeaminase